MESNHEVQQEAPEFRIDEELVKSRIEALKDEQNLGNGIIGGLLGGLMGAMLWALITYATDYQIGWMAVGVGFLVGLGLRSMGRGMERIFGVAGALMALLSVVLGNFLVIIGMIAKLEGASIFEILFRFKYSLTFFLMKETFQVMDVLFYGIAIYAGYRYSFRKVTQADLLEGAIAPAD